MKQNRSLWAAILRTLSSCKPRLLVALCNIDNIHYVNDLRGQESPGCILNSKPEFGTTIVADGCILSNRFFTMGTYVLFF